MRIIGPDYVVFGVENLEECKAYLADFGLSPKADSNGVYEAMDKTGVIVRDINDPSLPAPLSTGSTLRQVVWGCEDQTAIDEIADELSKDREVVRKDDGSIWAKDDLGFENVYQVTVREELDLPGEVINSPGSKIGRPVNQLGTDTQTNAIPRTLSHVVLFVPDSDKLEAFYRDRLGFRTTDKFVGGGPFMQSAINKEHHSVFFIQTPPSMQGIEHLAFHMLGPSEVMEAGARFRAKGYKSFWGPGRHIFGSNWFWYFKSPFGCHFEYDADMDYHDENWTARIAPMSADTSQKFLFVNADKWAPGPENGPPPQIAQAPEKLDAAE